MNQILLIVVSFCGVELSLASQSTYNKIFNLDTYGRKCPVDDPYNEFVKVPTRSRLECASKCKIEGCVRFYFDPRGKVCSLNLENGYWNPRGAGRCSGSFWRKPTPCPKNYTYFPEIDGCYFAGMQLLTWNESQKFCSKSDKQGHAMIVQDSRGFLELSVIEYFIDQSNQTLPPNRCPMSTPTFWTSGLVTDMKIQSNVAGKFFLPKNKTILLRVSWTDIYPPYFFIAATKSSNVLYKWSDKICVICEYHFQ